MRSPEFETIYPHWVTLSIHDQEIYGYNNSLSLISHISFVNKSMSINHDISRFDPQKLKR